MKFAELLQHIAADGQMPLLAQAFRFHDAAKVGIPFFGGLLLGIVFERETAQVFLADAFGIAIIGAQQILHLPEIEQIFCAIGFAKFLCNNHAQ